MSTTRSLGLISAVQSAEILGCTVQHARLLIRRGKLPAERIGRDWLVPEEAVRAYAAARYKCELRDPALVREPAQVESLFPQTELQSIVNVASVPKRSPFRYPGGKTWLIPTIRTWLGGLQPRPLLLVEPFAGGGGVALAAAFEGYVKQSLLVELDPDVAAVWTVMTEGGGLELAQRIRNFDFSQDHVLSLLAVTPSDLVSRAFLTILRNRVSRGGILAPGAGLVKNGEAGRGMASRWYPETLARRIEAIHERRCALSFQQGDGLQVLHSRATDRRTAFFIDPPYPVAGKRLYRYHDLDHRRLFEKMCRLEGPFLATYDHNPQIEALAKEFRLATRLVPMKSTHHSKKCELLIGRSFDWLPMAVTN